VRRFAAALLAALPLAACDPGWALNNQPPPPGKCRNGTGVSQFLVAKFYRRALVDKDVRGGFEAFVSPEFVEHKPDVASSDRQGAIRLMEGLIARFPEAKWEVVRIVAGGDTAAVHARFTPAPGAEPSAIADFFRVADCRIVEHWDVVAGPVEGAANPLPRF
jgi:predicted SnoaL-like aldol condensation-catalyzing enzyme